jgi:AmiR/NasT family two-component response regulator
MPDERRPDAVAALSCVRGRRVLVAEDEYLLAEDLRAALEQQGAEVMGPVAKMKGMPRVLSTSATG